MRYIAITGPTGSGKSQLAIGLAREFGAEVIGCDSVQVYKGFDIGSAKESCETRTEIPHHLIDIVDWHNAYNAAQYSRDAKRVIEEINARGKLAIVAGGTGLYLRALAGANFHDLPTDPVLRAELDKLSTAVLFSELNSLDPERARVLHKNDRLRLLRALELVSLAGKPIGEMTAANVSEFPPVLSIYINPPRPVLHDAIAERSRRMLGEGLIDEVRSLIQDGCPSTIKPMQSIGYSQVVEFLEGSIASRDLVDRIIFATRQYAKRQCTWFGKLSHDLSLDSALDLRAVAKLIRERLL